MPGHQVTIGQVLDTLNEIGHEVEVCASINSRMSKSLRWNWDSDTWGVYENGDLVLVTGSTREAVNHYNEL